MSTVLICFNEEHISSNLTINYAVTICLFLYDVFGYMIFVTAFTILSWIALTKYKTRLISYQDNLLLSIVIIGGTLTVCECIARCTTLGPRHNPIISLLCTPRPRLYTPCLLLYILLYFLCLLNHQYSLHACFSPIASVPNQSHHCSHLSHHFCVCSYHVVFRVLNDVETNVHCFKAQTPLC